MDALSLISEKLDVERVLNHFGFKEIRHDSTFIRACCKLHDGNNASGFVISEETGLWFCHTGGCGGGDIFTLVEKVESTSFPRAVRKVAEICGVSLDGLPIAERKSDWMKDVQRFIRTMRERKKDTKPNEHNINVERRKVTKFRGFLPSTIETFGLFFCDEMICDKRDGGKYVLRNRLTIPLIMDSVEVGFSLRRTNNTDIPKWSHQPANINVGDMLYNMERWDGKSPIVIVEGIFDVWAYHEINVFAACTFGAHLTREQYRTLIRSGADISLSYDADDAGRNATDKARALLHHKCNLSIITLPEGNDPCSVDRDTLRACYESRRRV